MVEADKRRVELLLSISVVGVISYQHYLQGEKLLLARKSDSGKWTLPSGGIVEITDEMSGETRIETPQEALQRELNQETGLSLDYSDARVYFRPALRGVINLKHPSKPKNSLGFVYSLHLGFDPEILELLKPKDEEISELKFFSPKELERLLTKPEELLYRPDFNEGLIRWWTRNEFTHDNMSDPFFNDGELDEQLLKKLVQDKAWI